MPLPLDKHEPTSLEMDFYWVPRKPTMPVYVGVLLAIRNGRLHNTGSEDDPIKLSPLK